MRINLPPAYIDLFRTTHYYPWNFWHHFGWFPDRDGSSLNATSAFWMETDKVLTEQQKIDIYNFFDLESTFLAPPFVTKIVLDLDYVRMQQAISNYVQNDPTLTVKYVGEGVKQVLYCSREPTNAELQALKNLWLSMISVVTP